MAVPGEDEYNLKNRFQRMKRRGENGWEDFEEFFDWAKENGYFKGAFLRRKDMSKPYGPGNCYWSKVVEPIMGDKQHRAHKIDVISSYCSGCRTQNPETCGGCLEWEEWFIDNWNRNIYSGAPEKPVEENVEEE
jgi:hypothetical protein